MGTSGALRGARVILVVDQSTRAREHVALRAMFAARKRVFVDLLKWDLPVLAGSFEVDRRDGPGATYLIVAGPAGEHRASVRLLREPAAALGLAARQIAGAGAPREIIVEVTHFCLSPDIDAAGRRRARDQLLHGLVDFALARGIHRLVGMVEPRWLSSIAAVGWVCRRLDAVDSGDGQGRVGIAVDIDATTAARLTAAGIARPSDSVRIAS